ncbi:hypothetical protein HIM_00206 [Hirsutella minnesotensis 3608]|nr:hypothetical protein HIM_00206 [Hirsutella minnesotensis 3608]
MLWIQQPSTRTLEALAFEAVAGSRSQRGPDDDGPGRGGSATICEQGGNGRPRTGAHTVACADKAKVKRALFAVVKAMRRRGRTADGRGVRVPRSSAGGPRESPLWGRWWTGAPELALCRWPCSSELPIRDEAFRSRHQAPHHPA